MDMFLILASNIERLLYYNATGCVKKDIAVWYVYIA